MSFRFLEHTADARIECRAETFHGLLESAAQALYAVTLTAVREDAEAERAVHVVGDSREDVLVRWLQELLYLLDVEQFVAARFAFRGVDDLDVVVEAAGYTCGIEERAKEVKSATYHELAVSQTGDEFIARFILDL